MIEHHPSDETLARLAAGALETGPSLVVAAHVAQCAHCRKAMRMLENVGGVALDQTASVGLTSNVTALLADPEAAAQARMTQHAMRHPSASPLLSTAHAGSRSRPRRAMGEGKLPRTAWDGLALPSPLAAYEATPWRMVGPGIHWARVQIPQDPAAKVLLLRAVPGTGLPPHTHTGTEYTCILQGAFQDGDRHMQVGDLSECDETEHHRPMVNSTQPCVCVLAVEGKLVMEGWLARLAQRIVGL